MCRFKFLVILSCFTGHLFSQSPGGVGTTNLRGWFDAGTGVTLTGGAVSAWTDRSTIGNASQATAASRPVVTSNSFNYNDALTFDGANDFLDLADRVASTATAVSIYAVARQANTSADPWGTVFNGQADGPTWVGGGFGITAMNIGNTAQGFYVRDYDTKGVNFPISNGMQYLMSGTWNGTTANAVEAFRNGISAGTVAYTAGSVGDAGGSWIGSGNGVATDYCFNGNIAELIIYNIGHSAANNNKIMSYLGVKYGITLGINYLNSAGTTIYAPSGAYTNNIFGIGRDDGSGMIQKQSKNIYDTVRVYLSTLAASNSANTGAFSSNLSHVMVGGNAGNMAAAASTSVEFASGYGLYRRIDREWKVTNTNFTGTFSMDFKLNANAQLGSVTASQLRLLLDDDGNFAAGTNSSIASGSSGITITYANPIITVSGISTALIAAGATSFLTIGSASPSTPLPIELFDFHANENSGRTDLYWSTATEKNNDYFEIERSTDGSNFNTIATIASQALHGNSNSKLEYSQTDNSPADGINYYRLKQVDKDKTFSYSSLITVDNEDAKNIQYSVHPNPNAGDFYLEIKGVANNTEVELSLINVLGIEIYHSIFNINKQNSILHIAPEHKPENGVYYCRLRCGKSEKTIKLQVIEP